MFLRTNTQIIDRGISPAAAAQRQAYDLATEKMLLWFALPRLPSGVTIQDAKLVLAVVGPTGEGVELKIARILRNWDPAQATWMLRTPTHPWSAPGGVERVDFSSWSGVAVSVPPGTNNQTPVHVSFDVTRDLILSQRQASSRPGWAVSGTARVGGVRNLQLVSSPGLAVKYSGAEAAVPSGLAPGGL